ncbi:hypothetical protein MVLG_06951 [Microbotryum lychnidis-dioicae p1A1 Lamole]|uniref:Uncharacterized protein n=1 Tax=Microbotryum lychnidis-dioicae (strain p1A1 Lamole / MvSl-1064) TaxID=683840 RepID=U5HIV3_USTV1|nr:hypothetical protein MVLG_06951 [Microbotryum lychnidis-dioicae p1A1 Lamole]|eukprot:KDE02499.1 hypothetical protein MVLG_06951 [Microbotryum lychnidis-dioicae p1A1 Lamole]
MADKRDTSLIEPRFSGDDKPERAKPLQSPPPHLFHVAAALSSLEARLEESKVRRFDSEERVRYL